MKLEIETRNQHSKLKLDIETRNRNSKSKLEIQNLYWNSKSKLEIETRNQNLILKLEDETINQNSKVSLLILDFEFRFYVSISSFFDTEMIELIYFSEMFKSFGRVYQVILWQGYLRPVDMRQQIEKLPDHSKRFANVFQLALNLVTMVLILNFIIAIISDTNTQIRVCIMVFWIFNMKFFLKFRIWISDFMKIVLC